MDVVNEEFVISPGVMDSDDEETAPRTGSETYDLLCSDWWTPSSVTPAPSDAEIAAAKEYAEKHNFPWPVGPDL
jgi:hypothetical protein